MRLSQNIPSGTLRYRPDIDGLRALAVLGVVIYHAFPNALPGGFIGVDIFFVISGYLISGILYKGHRDGNFSFKEFYARRIRRLFPALITMMVITLGYGWLVMLPDEFRQLGKHVAAGTLFIQNFVFWGESGYFDVSANLKPLLHLWSLAVEEQYYIVFPLLLVLLWKKPKILLPAIGVIMIGTFVLNAVMSVQNGVSDFFLTPYRAWEFLGGSLLAWWHYDRGHEEEVPKHREVMSWGGVLLMGLGMGLLEKHQPYPGWRALLPVCGALLLIEGGKEAWFNRKVLSHPFAVWIGLLSYPLYLYHWPALSFVHIIKGEQIFATLIWAALGVALLLSVATYYIIEKGIRYSKSSLAVSALTVSFILLGGISFFVYKGWIKTNYALQRRNDKIEEAIKDGGMLEGMVWINSIKNKVVVCQTGGNGKKTLFYGDSNSMQYAPRLVRLLKNNSPEERGAIFINEGGVAPIKGMNKSERPNSLVNTFDDYLNKNPLVDRIVISAKWHLYFDNDPYNPRKIGGLKLVSPEGEKLAIKSIGDMIARLIRDNKKVTLVLSTPTSKVMDPHNMYLKSFWGIKKEGYVPYLQKNFLKEHGEILSKIALVAKSKGAEVIDPLDHLCTNGVCISVDENGIPIRFDESHLRPGYVREHVKYLDQTVLP